MDMDKERLKLIVKNLKLLTDSLESEVYSDVDSYVYSGGNSKSCYRDDYDDDGYAD